MDSQIAMTGTGGVWTTTAVVAKPVIPIRTVADVITLKESMIITKKEARLMLGLEG